MEAGSELDAAVMAAMGWTEKNGWIFDEHGNPGFPGADSQSLSTDMAAAYAHVVPWLRGRGYFIEVYDGDDDGKLHSCARAWKPAEMDDTDFHAMGKDWSHALSLLALAVAESEVKDGD